jgi:hypothetical protein
LVLSCGHPPLQEALRAQHTKFVDGYFCSLLYVKQTDQLVTMEDWASGKARSKAEGRWVKQSRQLVGGNLHAA